MSLFNNQFENNFLADREEEIQQRLRDREKRLLNNEHKPRINPALDPDHMDFGNMEPSNQNIILDPEEMTFNFPPKS